MAINAKNAPAVVALEGNSALVYNELVFYRVDETRTGCIQ